MATIGTLNAVVHTTEISKEEDVKATKSTPTPVPQLPTLEK